PWGLSGCEPAAHGVVWLLSRSRRTGWTAEEGYVRRPRTTLSVLTLGLAAATVGACAGESGPPTLTWYINPDNGGQEEIARICTEEAEGEYRIETSLLPRDAASQREQLARRLAASDSSIDIMSLDPPFIPEMAAANFLAPVPEELQDTEDIVQGAVDSATWDGDLGAAHRGGDRAGPPARGAGHEERVAHRVGQRPRRLRRRADHREPRGSVGRGRARPRLRRRAGGRGGPAADRPGGPGRLRLPHGGRERLDDSLPRGLRLLHGQLAVRVAGDQRVE